MEVDVDDNDRDPVASLGCNDDDVCFFGRCTRNKKLGPLWVTTLGRHYTASCRWCSASAIVIACRARAAATASAAACRPAAVSPKQLAPELLQHHPSQPPQNHVLCFCVIADYPRGWVPFRSQTRGRHPSPLPETHTKTQSRRKIRRPDDCWFVQHPPKTNASWSSVFLVENEETLPNSNTLPMNLFFRTTPQQFGDLSTEHHPTFKRTCSYARK